MDTKSGLLLMCVLSRVQFDPNVAVAFLQFQIVPDVLDKAPRQELSVEYNGKKLHLGLEFTPTEVKSAPTVTWDACPTEFYTFIMLDPDAPSRTDHSISEWFHWLVVNIPGTDIARGETKMAYIGSGPQLNSGLHRYTFLVYKQKSLQYFSEQYLNDSSTVGRNNNSVRRFALRHGLGFPIAGNFYQCQWDSYVPILYKQIGLE